MSEVVIQADVMNFYKNELKAGWMIAYTVGFTSLIWILVMIAAHSAWETKYTPEAVKEVVAKECREQIHQYQMQALFTQ